jgi:cyclic pyranopterin phosphate synthase
VLDRYNRNINYLRVSVTDRCNLRCVYCMPEDGIRLLSHEEILSFDEIKKFTEAAVIKGVTKVRITGGEPLVRKGITTLVSMK